MELSHPAAAFGLGVALGSSPGPVQLLLFSEASRGGLGRGFRAMAGANGTFAVLLLTLAAGLSSIEFGDALLRAVEIAGGGFLIWLAWSAVRESRRLHPDLGPPTRTRPLVRGALAVLLNPGAWIFLATTGTAVVTAAARDGGRALAFLTVGALLVGVSVTDGGMVVLAGAGAGRLSDRSLRGLNHLLAIGLAGVGVWLVAQGVSG